MTQYSYTVTFDPAGAATDITDFVERVEWTEIGTGEVSNAKLRLNAQDGQFITSDTSLSGVPTPILDEFDRIRLLAVDRNSVVYDRTYEVDNTKPIQNTQQGTVLEVDLLGLEHHLQRTQFAKQFYFESAFTVSNDLSNFYNSPETKGTLQPILTEFDNPNFNTLPVWTANHYNFNISEETIYDGLMNVVDRVGSSIASGGAGDFWDLWFTQNFADSSFNSLIFHAQISGNPLKQQDVNGDFDPNTAVIIDDSVAVNPAEEEGGIQSTRATVAGTWAADGFGTLPTQSERFQGALEAWSQSPIYISGETYPQDVIVRIPGTVDSQGDENHYQANTRTSTTPPSGDWDQYFFTDYLANEVSISGQYSLWTNNADNEWKSSCANPNGLDNQDPPDFDDRACWDSNLVIYDGDVFRTWADIRAVDTAAIPAQYKRNGLFYRGFRILIDTSIGVPTGELAGFSNGDVVQCTGNDSVNNFWSVHRALAFDQQCAVDDEGVVYESQLGVLVDISGSVQQANDCYHNNWAIFNSQGFNNKNNGAGGNFGEFSAVTHEFRYRNGDANSGVTDEPLYYRIWAGFNFRIPFPHDSYNLNSIGSLYGDNDKLEPATLDSNNMHLSHDGQVGFNHTSANDLGPLDAISFAIKMEWRYEFDGSGSLVPRGNIPFRCFMYDTSDNVVVQDFTISVNNLWETITLPFTSFRIYRARAGWSFGNIGQNVFLQQLEILNVFEYKNIVKIGIQWLGPYDDQGRFTPFQQKNDIFWQITDVFNLDFNAFVSGYNIKLSADDFKFTKPILAISPPDSDRSLLPEFFQEPFISNSIQAEQANLAALEVFRFRHQQYEVNTEGTFDIEFGDTFFLKNDTLVNASDFGPNTIQLVAKKITYTIDKPPTGVGGFLRHITGVKRIT